VAAFDTDPRMIGERVGAVVVRPMADLSEMVKGERVDIAVLATPAAVAQDVTDTLIEAGVTSILNFAPVRLQVPPRVAVRQVDLGVELQILSYYEHLAAVGPVDGDSLVVGHGGD
jgi:redox-sensing transcriptional repressor